LGASMIFFILESVFTCVNLWLKRFK